MIVAELTGLRQFQLQQQPTPDPLPGHVQVQVKAVGICGSDLHYYFEGGIGDTPCVYPMVLGHEPSGIVLRCGPGVSGWSKGDRVILEPAVYCYHCEFCLSGRHNVCANLRFFSTPSDPGFFRDVMNLPATNVVPMPESLSYEEGTLAEPLAIAFHSMTFAAPRPGETVALFGAGPIGLLTLIVLKLAGTRVWMMEPVAHRRELARKLGADATLDPKAIDIVRQIKQDTGGRGVDIAIDCAAKNGTMNQCLHVARNAARVVYTGIPGEPAITIDFHEIRRKELTIYNVRRSNHETNLAVALLRERPTLFGDIVSHRIPMERVSPAFDMMEHYSDGASKVIIQP